MPTRWWEGHANSLLDDWFCVLGAGCEKSFKITTIRQSQVFHSVWFLISFKRGHVSHWKVRYTLNKNTLSWTSVPEIDENLSLKRNEVRIHVTTWVNNENMLRERSESQKAGHRMILFIENVQNKQIYWERKETRGCLELRGGILGEKWVWEKRGVTDC